MQLLLSSIALSLISGFAALLVGRKLASAKIATVLGCGGALISGLVGLVGTISTIVGFAGSSTTPGASTASEVVLSLPWQAPYGTFSVGIDPLSAFFLIIVFVLGGLTALHGSSYLLRHRSGKPLGTSWFFFNVLLAAMALVLIARNGLLFLMSWEVMALSSFFLVTFEDDREEVRTAGQIYLIATHLGVAFLFVFFIMLGAQAGSLDFDRMAAVTGLSPAFAGAMFLLAVVGFGSKAGFVPFHVWLPEAYPAAPGHVAALMSGAMSKTGIYGILRVLILLTAGKQTPAQWWGWLLVGAGMAGGLLGILFGLAQHELKRFLAYSSVENLGIVAMGLGLGVLGMSVSSPVLVALGFGGALLHVLNHALFKGLLFMGAGAVVHAAGTGKVDVMGGLFKKMPVLSVAFLIGSIAICGLPPLNGFSSEFTIYLAAFHGLMASPTSEVLPPLLTMISLVAIGGLAVAGFTKVFGIVFLGEPRTPATEKVRLPGRGMTYPVYVLAVGCVVAAFTSPFILKALMPVVGLISGTRPQGVYVEAIRPVSSVVVAAGAFVGVMVLIAAARFWLLKGRSVRTGLTWDCGYAAPTARMQYTGSSFTRPITQLFQLVLQGKKKGGPPSGYFPHSGSLGTYTPDVFEKGFYVPLFTWFDKRLGSFRRLQHGRIQLYVLYIVLTLIVTLVWKLGVWS